MSGRAKPERFEARASPPKILRFATLALVMTAVSALVAHRGEPFGLIIGCVGTAFFGLCTLGILRQLFYRGPIIVIGPEGVTWQRWSDSAIPWKAFARARVTNSMVALWLVDPSAHRSRKLLGRLARLNSIGGYGDINLMAQLLDCSFEDMADAVYRHRPSLFRR